MPWWIYSKRPFCFNKQRVVIARESNWYHGTLDAWSIWFDATGRPIVYSVFRWVSTSRFVSKGTHQGFHVFWASIRILVYLKWQGHLCNLGRAKIIRIQKKTVSCQYTSVRDFIFVLSVIHCSSACMALFVWCVFRAQAEVGAPYPRFYTSVQCPLWDALTSVPVVFHSLHNYYSFGNGCVWFWKYQVHFSRGRGKRKFWLKCILSCAVWVCFLWLFVQ